MWNRHGQSLDGDGDRRSRADLLQEIATLKAERDRLRGQVYASSAECAPSCEDPHCPYTHTPTTWKERAEVAEAYVARLTAALDEMTARQESQPGAGEAGAGWPHEKRETDAAKALPAEAGTKAPKWKKSRKGSADIHTIEGLEHAVVDRRGFGVEHSVTYLGEPYASVEAAKAAAEADLLAGRGQGRTNPFPNP